MTEPSTVTAMDGETTSATGATDLDDARRAAQHRGQTVVMVGVGVLLAGLGVVLGLVKAAQRQPCPRGNHHCSQYPEALDGTLLVLLFLVLALLLVVAGRACTAPDDRRPG